MTTAASRGEDAPRATRGWFWLQLAIAWVPVWALYATIMVTAHGGTLHRALFASARAIGAAALLSLVVIRFTKRVPWPRPVRPGFVMLQVGAAIVYSTAWVSTVIALESLVRGGVAIFSPPGIFPFTVLGVWLYFAVAGVSYAVRATERAAHAEAAAVRAQLAALRGQLNPHFLFNALHSVVQLIPVSPDRAAHAAELLAGLLRTAAQEDRDLVPLREEVAFAERYAELERLRFEERLRVLFDIDATVGEATVPAFALQTLVENAVRHGAEPRVEPTTIHVRAWPDGVRLILEVADDGVGVDPVDLPHAPGTGLRRLGERLDALFGTGAAIRFDGRPGKGLRATVTLPLDADEGT